MTSVTLLLFDLPRCFAFEIQHLPFFEIWHAFCSLWIVQTLGDPMKKIITIHGHRVALYSSDEGHSWSSDPQSTFDYGQREEILRGELNERFARIDGMQPAPNIEVGFDMPNRVVGRKKS